MKKLNKLILLITAFLLSLGVVNAVNVTLPIGNDLPIPLSESSRGTWANTYNSLLNNTFVILERVFTTTGFLKTGLNISTTNLNVSNNLVVLGNIYGEIPDSFKNSNWSSLYIAEASTRYSLTNFTSNYDARADRFLIANYTMLEDSAFRIENGTRLQFSNFQNANASGVIEGYIPPFFNNGNFSTRLDLASSAFFNNGNFTTRYDLRTDRYGKENFTAQIDSDGFFKLQNYSAEYSSTGYKLINFTNNYDSRTDRFGIVNGTTLPFSRFTIENITTRETAYFRLENGTALSFSNFRTENVSKGEQNPSNNTIFLPSQEKIDGLKSADSPKFTALNITNKVTIGGTDGTSKLQIIDGGVATANATANNCNVNELRVNVTSTTTGKICVCLNSLVIDEAVWKCSVLG